MFRLLLFMHHIVLCTPCIALFNCDHLLHIRIDHVEPISEIQVEQVQWMYGGPQASSCEDANIVMIKVSPDALINDPCLLLLNLALYSFMVVH
jgi:hypothetical protein